MELRSKVGLGVMVLALSCWPVMAQGDMQGPPPDDNGPAMMGPGGPMEDIGPGEEMGPGDEITTGQMRGQWGGRRQGFERREGMVRRGFGGERRGFGLARLLNDPAIREKIGVSAEQVAKIRQEETEFRKAEIRNRADLAVKRIDLENLMAAEKPDLAAIDSKLGEISAARLVSEKAAVHFRLTMRDALTAEQKEKLRQLMRERRGGQRGPGWRGGPQGMQRRGQRGPGGPSTAPAPGPTQTPQNN